MSHLEKRKAVLHQDTMRLEIPEDNPYLANRVINSTRSRGAIFARETGECIAQQVRDPAYRSGVPGTKMSVVIAEGGLALLQFVR